MQLQKRRVPLSRCWLLSCSAEPINTCPRFSQPLGFGGESWSQEAGLGSWLTAAHCSPCDLDSLGQAEPELCRASAEISSCSSARVSLHGGAALQMGSEPCPLPCALLGTLLEQCCTLDFCAHGDFNPTFFLGRAVFCSCEDALGAWAGRSWAGTEGLLRAPRGVAGAQQAGGGVRCQEVVSKYFHWEICCRTWRGHSRISDSAQAPLILCFQKSGSASAALESGKTQCSLFLLSDFLDFGLVLKFPSSCSFCECMSPGHAHTLSSSSRNKCLKHEVTEQDADSWVNLHLDRFGYVTQAFPSQFPVACATYFKMIWDCFFIVWQEPYGANQWTTPSFEWIRINLIYLCHFGPIRRRLL